ncbi:HDOD domain-containing protein [Thiospirillum jenense]|uniref:HDOD domain-containing protein n=1 Tax=Thiospirillum jenense TaxID=1653858 RepID=A0A839H863_9GAMM|nr:HDOD domain-containing protein [Thiospirillum jenense]MBB1125655.1 HDOD domain-containing protein [Thiospirillum jenense]
MSAALLVSNTQTLFSFPDVALRINHLIEQPTTRPDDLAAVILCDPGLSARVLRLVNSAYYARATPVATVSQAVRLIGQRALRDLVIATYATDLFKGLPPQQVNMERFWFHGVACGIAARELAIQCGLCGGEHLFLAGLLHSIGKLVFFSQCAEAYLNVFQLIESDKLTVVAAEEQVFGFNYADLGAELLKKWRFPELLWKAVAYHLTPTSAPDYRLEAEIVHSAEQVATIVQSTAIDGGDTLAASAAECLKTLAVRLALPEETVLTLPNMINLQIVEVFEILLPGSTLIY